MIGNRTQGLRILSHAFIVLYTLVLFGVMLFVGADVMQRIDLNQINLLLYFLGVFLAGLVSYRNSHNDMQKSDIDWLVPHQANIRIINATAKKLKMPMDHVVVTVQEHGNTSAASVPMALNEAVRDGRIKRGETIMLEAFGGGFTWGSALLRY